MWNEWYNIDFLIWWQLPIHCGSITWQWSCEIQTHLHDWQFFALAEKVEPLLLWPRWREDGTRLKIHHQPPKFVLSSFVFLSSMAKWWTFYHIQEAEKGWCKSSVQEDLVHVLTTIVDDLDYHLCWPDNKSWCMFNQNLNGVLELVMWKNFRLRNQRIPWRRGSPIAGKRRLIVLRCSAWWITLVASFFFSFSWVEMTEGCSMWILSTRKRRTKLLTCAYVSLGI